jgi:enoyl-CoA hydratase
VTGIGVRRDGPVAVLTIDRPAVRNALDPPALHALADAITAGDGLRALVLTGAGTAAFSSGMDLRTLARGPRTAVVEAVAAFDRALDDPGRPPIVAAVNGDATGGGFELVLRCDLAVAAEHVAFRLPEVRRGMVPGGRATLLPARIPLAIALEIALLGEPVPARRALELGLVNRVVPAGELLDTALDLGRRLAAAGPRALALTRELMWATAVDGAAAAWTRTRAALIDPELGAEMREGTAAFLEKRPPRW